MNESNIFLLLRTTGQANDIRIRLSARTGGERKRRVKKEDFQQKKPLSSSRELDLLVASTISSFSSFSLRIRLRLVSSVL